jgi:hypothetical protein
MSADVKGGELVPGQKRRQGADRPDSSVALVVHALESTASLPLEGIKSVTADPASLADLEAPSDHRPVIARFNL